MTGPTRPDRWRRRVVIGYLDEPPFCIPDSDGYPTGCDMDLAQRVLTDIGVGRIGYELTTFEELIPGLLDGRWELTTGIFITPERARLVDFTRPIWATRDGFIVRLDDRARYTSYEAIADDAHAILAVVAGQVQHHTAVQSGVPRERIVEFPDQAATVEAVRTGRADASASTAPGNRAFVEAAGDDAIAAVDIDPARARTKDVGLGAFAVSKASPDLTLAINRVLAAYLGSADHLARMATYGFTIHDLRPVLGLPA